MQRCDDFWHPRYSCLFALSDHLGKSVCVAQAMLKNKAHNGNAELDGKQQGMQVQEKSVVRNKVRDAR